ncbi:uncharacterized protein EDB91DRAFT_1249780 [Suillus paluster]|uniref:uncharacterized protein n=1 Tax=Suillus paluster TaxID=48578 RepID=UPI001B883931|nr:uncharacterized protein EDB91DRAFT_1249780 [Suillus paluster]KAG1737134.1 hypothetical protein EDB91DRAFT_1249780 [Suillus paluster]
MSSPHSPLGPRSTESPNAINVNSPNYIAELGEVPSHNPPRGHTYAPNHGGQGGHHHHNHGDNPNRSYHCESSDDTMSVFLQSPLLQPPYVPASRLAEELAIKKEAYTFTAQVKADHKKRLSSQLQHNHHLTLDNQRQKRYSNQQSHTPAIKQHAPAPMTTSQIIVDAINTPVNNPNPVPVDTAPTVDSGPDVLDIIVRAEELDLRHSTHLHGVANEDFFGRALITGLVLTNLLTMILLLAAMNSMGITSTS